MFSRVGYFLVKENPVGSRHRHAHNWRTRSVVCAVDTFWIGSCNQLK